MLEKQSFTAAAIINDISDGLTNIEPVLKKRNYQIDLFDASKDDLNTILKRNYDVVIILGGFMSAFETKKYPFLETELEIIRARVAKDLPVLGICLGAQLIARALGGKVYTGSGPELGWFHLQAQHDSLPNYLEPIFKENCKLMVSHSDTFELPPNAKLHASSERYENHIFTVGRNCLAIQAHPEATITMLTFWISHFPNQIKRDFDFNALNRDTAEYQEKTERAVALMWNRFFEHIETRKA